MVLGELMENIVKYFQCPDGVKYLLYKNRIECYEITDEYTYITGRLHEVTVPTSYAKMLTIYLDDENKIKTIDGSVLGLMTTANYKTYEWLTTLMEQKIDNYNTFNKLTDIVELGGMIVRPEGYDDYEEDKD